MQKDTILYIVIALLAGFIAGFMLANSLNRTEYVSNPAAMPANGMQITPGGPTEPALSPEEIRSKVVEADRNPENFAFQKNLGLSLYRYGAMTQNVGVLQDAERLLARAVSLNAKDFDVLVGLGNAEFDIGFYKKELASFDRARITYLRALELRPDDVDVRTDIGISYFVQEPPDYTRAEAELKKVVGIDPRHKRSIQFLVQLYAKQKRIPESREALEKLRAIDPSNPAVNELTSLVDAASRPANQ